MSEDVPSDTYVVTVSGPGITAEKEVGPSIAIAVMQVLFGGAAALAVVPGAQHGGTGTGTQAAGPPFSRLQPLSVREFLEASEGRSIHAKIATIGRYLRDYEGQEDFSREEVRNRFRAAGEAMPGNFPRDFTKALQSGWIAPDPQKRGRFYVTRKGDEAIDRKFAGLATSAPKSRRRASRSIGSFEEAEFE